jgi:RNA polymerase sigma-70 factor (ECF subfamily)
MAIRPDPSRFEDLYRSHRGAVYGALLRELRSPEDAEDATQSAFLQAFGAYERGSRPERPRAWLLTIAHNLRRRRFRSDRRAAEVPLDETLVGARPRDDRVDDLREALHTLPLNQRAALVLREVAGLSYAEIARQLSVSVGAVQMLIFRARRALREELATPSRRAGALVPGWLANLIPKAERFAPLRIGGVAAIAAAAAVAVSGAESASPPAVGERHLAGRPQVQATPEGAPNARSPLTPTRGVPRSKDDRGTVIVETASPSVTSPPATASAADGSAKPVEPPLLPAPVSTATPEPPELVVPVPVPTPTPPALPLPPIPLPKELEGTLDPQLDDVLAGR